MSTKLKPCPFCGRRKGLAIREIVDGNHEDALAVMCPAPTCCLGPARKTYEGAEAAWNRRKAVKAGRE